MKPFTTFAVIAISLLTATSCKPAQNAPAPNPPAQDTVATPDSQQNSNAPAVDEPQAQPDPSVAQNPSWEYLDDVERCHDPSVALDDVSWEYLDDVARCIKAQRDPSVAQNPSENADVQANHARPSESTEVKDYVDIPDSCRPVMTKPITAKDWAKANNAFGLKFLRETKGNTVFSPYSIERALGMTLDGACGTTASEMLAALEMPNAKRLSLAGRDVDDAMKSVNEDTLLEIDNTIWPDVSLTLPDDFLARISAGYRNKTVALDYRADPEKARVTINDDIAKSTHDRITDLIPPEIITDKTRLVLTNAVYFKSKWMSPFDEYGTETKNFYNSTKLIKTKIMHQTRKNSWVCIAQDYAIYDLPFDSSSEKNEKGAYVMRIVLPTIDDAHPMHKRMEYLENVEKQLPAYLTSMCNDSHFDIVYVAMPKFKLQPDTLSLRKMLNSMGMTKAFTNTAEFPSMPGLKIDDVFHKAFIEIDEKGGEAAAATGVGFGAGGYGPSAYYFTVDHPFIYMIIEKSTGAAIFMGRVTDL